MGSLTVILAFCSLLSFCLAEEEIIGYPIVRTNSGGLRGTTVRLSEDEIFDSFQGIPYGNPPIQSRRFTRPDPVQPWPGVIDVMSPGFECTQLLGLVYDLLETPMRTDENCLFLNVFVPKGVEYARRKPLPVMFFFHGGAFFMGSGSQYASEKLAMFGDVIVVSFNYRLGVLGFLSTGDDISPGNYGLWDGELALSWTKDNIHHFGGNPDEITIFGQSAGGALVSHTMISSKTNGLFKRAIAQSGGSTGFFGYTPNYLESLEELAEWMDCADDNLGVVVSCLRRTDAEILDLFGFITPLFIGLLPNWMPVIDYDFVEKNPSEMFREGAGSHIDFITGKTKDDSCGFVTLNLIGLWGNINTAEDKEVLEDLLDFFCHNSYRNGDAACEAMVNRYSRLHLNDSDIRLQELSNLTTDWWFGSGSHFEAVHHSIQASRNRKKTYVYEFSYKPSFSTLPDWSRGSHVEDLHFVFGDVFFQPLRDLFTGKNFTEEDYETNRIMMSYWTNFATNGDPNMGKQVPARWDQYNTRTRKVARIYDKMTDADVTSEDPYYVDTYKFWYDDMERIGGGSRSNQNPVGSERFLCPRSWKTDEKVFTGCLNTLLKVLPLDSYLVDGLKLKIIEMYHKVQQGRHKIQF